MPSTPAMANDPDGGPATGRADLAHPEARQPTPRCRRCGTQVCSGTTDCGRCAHRVPPRTAAPAWRPEPDPVSEPVAPLSDSHPRKCPSCGGRLSGDAEGCRQCGRDGSRPQAAAAGASEASAPSADPRRDVLPACGYLLAVAGFSATVAPGCGLGLASSPFAAATRWGPPVRRWCGGATV